MILGPLQKWVKHSRPVHKADTTSALLGIRSLVMQRPVEERMKVM